MLTYIRAWNVVRLWLVFLGHMIIKHSWNFTPLGRWSGFMTSDQFNHIGSLSFCIHIDAVEVCCLHSFNLLIFGQFVVRFQVDSDSWEQKCWENLPDPINKSSRKTLCFFSYTPEFWRRWCTRETRGLDASICQTNLSAKVPNFL